MLVSMTVIQRFYVIFYRVGIACKLRSFGIVCVCMFLCFCCLPFIFFVQGGNFNPHLICRIHCYSDYIQPCAYFSVQDMTYSVLSYCSNFSC